ncbi:E3 ubiquitin-protein ligase tom1 [Mitosporidium daphniae]
MSMMSNGPGSDPSLSAKGPSWVNYYTCKIVALCNTYIKDPLTEQHLIAVLKDFSFKANQFVFPQTVLVFWVSALNALDILMSKILANLLVPSSSLLLISILEFEKSLLDMVSISAVAYSSIDRILQILDHPGASEELKQAALLVAVAATSNVRKAHSIPGSKDLIVRLERLLVPFFQSPNEAHLSPISLLAMSAYLQLKGDKKGKKILSRFPGSLESVLVSTIDETPSLLLLNAIVKLKGKLPSTSPLLSSSLLQRIFRDPRQYFHLLKSITSYPAGAKKLLAEGILQAFFSSVEDLSSPLPTKVSSLLILIRIVKRIPDQFIIAFSELSGFSRLSQLLSGTVSDASLYSLLKLVLKLVLIVTQRFPTRDDITSFPEGPLPTLLATIIDHAASISIRENNSLDDEIALSSEYLISGCLLSMEIFTTWIHSEPTSLSIFQEFKITKRILDSLLLSYSGISPRITEALPAILTAFSLNENGISAMLQYSESLELRISEAIVPARSNPILIDPDSFGEALDELARHQPSLKPIIARSLVLAVRRLPSLIGLAEDIPCPISDCFYPSRTSLSQDVCRVGETDAAGIDHEHPSAGWPDALESLSIIIELFITTAAHLELFCKEMNGISILIESVFSIDEKSGHCPEFDFCLSPEAYSFAFLLRHFANSCPDLLAEALYPIIESFVSQFNSQAHLADSELFIKMSYLCIALRSFCDLWTSERLLLSTLHPDLLSRTLNLMAEKGLATALLGVIQRCIQIHWDARMQSAVVAGSTLTLSVSCKRNLNAFLFLASQLVSMSVVALSIWSRLLLEDAQKGCNHLLIESQIIFLQNAISCASSLSPASDCSIYHLCLTLRISRVLLIDDPLNMKSLHISLNSVVPAVVSCVNYVTSQLNVLDSQCPSLPCRPLLFPEKAAISGAYDNDSIWKGILLDDLSGSRVSLIGRTLMDALELLSGIMIVLSSKSENLCEENQPTIAAIEHLISDLLSPGFFSWVPSGTQLLILQIFKFTSKGFQLDKSRSLLIPSLVLNGAQNDAQFVLKAAAAIMSSAVESIDAFVNLVGCTFDERANLNLSRLSLLVLGLQVLGHPLNMPSSLVSQKGTLVALLGHMVPLWVNEENHAVPWILALLEWIIKSERLFVISELSSNDGFEQKDLHQPADMEVYEMLFQLLEQSSTSDIIIPQELLYQSLRLLNLVLPTHGKNCENLIPLLLKLLWNQTLVLPTCREAGVSAGKRPVPLSGDHTVPGSGVMPLIIFILRGIIEARPEVGPLLALQNAHEKATVHLDFSSRALYEPRSAPDSKVFKLDPEPGDFVAGLGSVLRDPTSFFSFLKSSAPQEKEPMKSQKKELTVNGEQLATAKKKLFDRHSFDARVVDQILDLIMQDEQPTNSYCGVGSSAHSQSMEPAQTGHTNQSWKLCTGLAIVCELLFSYPVLDPSSPRWAEFLLFLTKRIEAYPNVIVRYLGKDLKINGEEADESLLIQVLECGWIIFLFSVLLAAPIDYRSSVDKDPGILLLNQMATELNPESTDLPIFTTDEALPSSPLASQCASPLSAPLKSAHASSHFGTKPSILRFASILARAFELVPKLSIGTLSVDAYSLFNAKKRSFLTERLSTGGIGSTLLDFLSRALERASYTQKGEFQAVEPYSLAHGADGILLEAMLSITKFLDSNPEKPAKTDQSEETQTKVLAIDDEEWSTDEYLDTHDESERNDDDGDDDDFLSELDDGDSSMMDFLDNQMDDEMMVINDDEEEGDESSLSSSSSSSSSSSMEEEEEAEIETNNSLMRPTSREPATHVMSFDSDDEGDFDEDDYDHDDQDDAEGDDEEFAGDEDDDGEVDGAIASYQRHRRQEPYNGSESENSGLSSPESNRDGRRSPFDQIFPPGEDIIIRSSMSNLLFSAFDDEDHHPSHLHLYPGHEELVHSDDDLAEAPTYTVRDIAHSDYVRSGRNVSPGFQMIEGDGIIGRAAAEMVRLLMMDGGAQSGGTISGGPSAPLASTDLPATGEAGQKVIASSSFLLLAALRDASAMHLLPGKEKRTKKKKMAMGASAVFELLPISIERQMPSEADPGPISWTLGARPIQIEDQVPPGPNLSVSSSSDASISSSVVLRSIAMLRPCSTVARARQLGVLLDAPHDLLQPHTGKLLRRGPFNERVPQWTGPWSILLGSSRAIFAAFSKLYVEQVVTEQQPPLPEPPIVEVETHVPVQASAYDGGEIENDSGWISVDSDASGDASQMPAGDTDESMEEENHSASTIEEPVDVESGNGADPSAQWPILYVTPPQLDTQVLEALPEEMQREIFSSYFYERRQNNPGPLRLALSPEFMEQICSSALRSLILEMEAQEREEHLRTWTASGTATTYPTTSQAMPPSLTEALGSLFAAAGMTLAPESHRRRHAQDLESDAELDDDTDDNELDDELHIDHLQRRSAGSEDFTVDPAPLFFTNRLAREGRRVRRPAALFLQLPFETNAEAEEKTAKETQTEGDAKLDTEANSSNFHAVSDSDQSEAISLAVVERAVGAGLSGKGGLPRRLRAFLGVVLRKNGLPLLMAALLDRFERRPRESGEEFLLLRILDWLLRQPAFSLSSEFETTRMGEAVARRIVLAPQQNERCLVKGLALLRRQFLRGLSPHTTGEFVRRFLLHDAEHMCSERLFHAFLLLLKGICDAEDSIKQRRLIFDMVVRSTRERIDALVETSSKNLDAHPSAAATFEMLLRSARALSLFRGPEYSYEGFGTTLDSLIALFNSQLQGKVEELAITGGKFACVMSLLLQALFLLASLDGQALAQDNVSLSSPNVTETPAPDSNKHPSFAPSQRLVEFATRHRDAINAKIRERPSLLLGAFGPFRILGEQPAAIGRRVLDFEIKRTWLARALRRSEPRPAPLALRIRRDRLFEDSFREIMTLPATALAERPLSIAFDGEEGVDAGGLTREWFSLLAQQMLNAGYALFLPVGGGQGGSGAVFYPNRLSAVNPEHLDYFEFVGRIIGKAVVESQLLACHFACAFYKILLDIPLELSDLEAVDASYYRSLAWMLSQADPEQLEELSLFMVTELDDFGRPRMVDLIPNGSTIPVTADRIEEYVSLTVDVRLRGALEAQFDAIRRGLFGVLSQEILAIFTEKELELFISGLALIDDIDDWKRNTEYGTGYTATSPQVVWFWRAVRSMSYEERSQLLQFVTGSMRVPLGGFSRLLGSNGALQRFSIHRDTGGAHRLPQAHTCFNQLDIPEYESYEQLRRALLVAIREGTTGFGLV